MQAYSSYRPDQGSHCMTSEITSDWFSLALNTERRFKELVRILKYESRFVLPESYKSFVDTIVRNVNEHFTSIIPADTILFRGRINDVSPQDHNDEVPPFPAEQMGTPPRQLAGPGRINPEGISYLYCAGDMDTAGAELRPWKGAWITIAEVKIVKDIKIADLTLDCEDQNWSIFYDEFSKSFSVQWPPALKINYLSTQFFSEHFKASGLRGIKYKSEFNEGGDNYSLFSGEDYLIVNTFNVEVMHIGTFVFDRRKRNY
jgi:hypothetical protein